MAARKHCAKRMIESHQRARQIRSSRKHDNPLVARIAQIEFFREVISKEISALEPMLVSTKWLQYQYMSAFECNELFCVAFDEAFRRVYAQYYDFQEAEQAKPISKVYAENDRGEMTSLCIARQQADLLGVPYPLFIRVAMDTAVQQMKHKRIPRPNQLCTPGLLEAVRNEWDRVKSVESLLGPDWDSRFFDSSSTFNPPRKQALAAIKQRVDASKNPATTLGHYLGRAGAVVECEARDLFGDELVDAAFADPSYRSSTRSSGKSSEVFLMPCLGLRPEASNVTCDACPVREICDRIKARVDTRMLAKWGTIDPRGDRVRVLARDRKRRQREREKATSLIVTDMTDRYAHRPSP